MKSERLTIRGIRKAKLGDGGGFKQGKPAMFPGKRPGLIYLTDWSKARLKALAVNAGVSLSDFLEILIRRYGDRTGSDIATALGEPDDE